MLMEIERVRAKILEPPEGWFNLALEDFGLTSAIRIIAECAEKRIELGEDADTALDVAVDMFEAYLETSAEQRNGPFSFAQWMADTYLPVIKLPSGIVVNNPEAPPPTPANSTLASLAARYTR